MAEEYTVHQGDSLTSIAFEHGFNWKKIWNHSQNAQLKSLRKDPHVLYPGDILYIPDKESRIEQCAVDAEHRFVCKIPLDRLRIRLLQDFKPRANEAYKLIIDGKIHNGCTDGDGMIDARMSPAAKQVRLVLKGGEEQYELALGHLDPLETVEGVQARLRGMGILKGEVNGEMDGQTRSALRSFQASNKLPETGEPDDGTLSKLKSEYGC